LAGNWVCFFNSHLRGAVPFLGASPIDARTKRTFALRASGQKF